MDANQKKMFRAYFIGQLKQRKFNERYAAMSKKLNATKKEAMQRLCKYFRDNPECKAIRVAENAWAKPCYSYTQVVLKPEHFHHQKLSAIIGDRRLSAEQKACALTDALNTARTRRRESVSTVIRRPKNALSSKTPPVQSHILNVAKQLHELTDTLKQLRAEKKKKQEILVQKLQGGGGGTARCCKDVVRSFMEGKNRKSLTLSMTVEDQPQKFCVKLYDSRRRQKVSKKRLLQLIREILTSRSTLSPQEFQDLLLTRVAEGEIKTTANDLKLVRVNS